jgi:hypothetical protein
MARRMVRSPNMPVLILSAMSPLVHCPVLVTLQVETVHKRPPTVEAVVHKDLEGDHQLFLPKHLLQIAVGIVLLEWNAMLLYLTNGAVVIIYIYI